MSVECIKRKGRTPIRKLTVQEKGFASTLKNCQINTNVCA